MHCWRSKFQEHSSGVRGMTRAVLCRGVISRTAPTVTPSVSTTPIPRLFKHQTAFWLDGRSHQECLTHISSGISPQTQIFRGFLDSSVGKESTCNAGDPGLILGLGRSTGEGKMLLTSVLWPGELPQLYSPWSCKESDWTEQLSLSFGPPLWLNW